VGKGFGTREVEEDEVNVVVVVVEDVLSLLAPRGGHSPCLPEQRFGFLGVKK